jgi:hypothetical protein
VVICLKNAFRFYKYAALTARGYNIVAVGGDNGFILKTTARAEAECAKKNLKQCIGNR